MLPCAALAGLLLAATPAEQAHTAAQALCAEDARCQDAHDCYERPRCTEVVEPPFALPAGLQAVELVAERPSAGEGNLRHERYYAWDGKGLVLLFEVASDSGGEGSRGAVESRLVVCRAASGGVPNLDIVQENTEADTSEEGDASDRRVMVRHLVWSGQRFDASPAAAVCAPRLEPHPPAYLKSVSASSTLVEKAEADSYQPQNAADGLPETAWAEGAKGPGLNQWLELTLARPLALQAVRLAPGCGVNEDLWRENERLKKVRLVFSDGATQEAALPDSRPGQLHSIAIARTRPTTSLRIVVLEVYPAKFQDACLSEVEMVERPAPAR